MDPRRLTLVACGCLLWAAAAPAGQASHGFTGPRNILHADVLALSAGERLAGAYWEHLRREDTGYWSFVAGLGVAWDWTVEPLGELDVTSVPSLQHGCQQCFPLPSW